MAVEEECRKQAALCLAEQCFDTGDKEILGREVDGKVFRIRKGKCSNASGSLGLTQPVARKEFGRIGRWSRRAATTAFPLLRRLPERDFLGEGDNAALVGAGDGLVTDDEDVFNVAPEGHARPVSGACEHGFPVNDGSFHVEQVVFLRAVEVDTHAVAGELFEEFVADWVFLIASIYEKSDLDRRMFFILTRGNPAEGVCQIGISECKHGNVHCVLGFEQFVDDELLDFVARREADDERGAEEVEFFGGRGLGGECCGGGGEGE